MSEADEGPGIRMALEIEAFLDDFARRHAAITWKQLVGDDGEWRTMFLVLMSDPNVIALFNVKGVDIWRGLARANTPRRTVTDWELLQIRQNTQWWPRIVWMDGDRTVPNPFDEDRGES